MMRLTAHHLEDTLALGRAIGSLCEAGDVIALDGELGAGKTQLVCGLADGLGLDPHQVSSPTFVFVQEYTPPEADTSPPEGEAHEKSGDETSGAASSGGGGPVLVHVDAYRLRNADELDTLGWGDELLEGAVLAVEWADRIASRLGPDLLHVTLEHAGETKRLITLTPHGKWSRRIATLRERCNPDA